MAVASKDAPTPERLFPLPGDAERERQREEAKIARSAAALADKEAMLARIAARNARKAAHNG